MRVGEVAERSGANVETLRSLLHIANGDSAGNTLRQTALGGAVVPWQDTLYEGSGRERTGSSRSTTPPPYLRLLRSATASSSHDSTCGLTEPGERTLRGEADRVDLLGIDRWIGGTHITPDNAWRWDPTTLRLVRP
jgi:hypothetical protein